MHCRCKAKSIVHDISARSRISMLSSLLMVNATPDRRSVTPSHAPPQPRMIFSRFTTCRSPKRSESLQRSSPQTQYLTASQDVRGTIRVACRCLSTVCYIHSRRVPGFSSCCRLSYGRTSSYSLLILPDGITSPTAQHGRRRRSRYFPSRS